MTRLRPAQLVASFAVLLFWVGTAVAGAMSEGYSARDDVVSTLAGRGSPVAFLGIVSILSLALAHAAAAGALARPSRIAARLLLGAAGATAVIAGFRTSNGMPDDPIDLVHAAGVAAYQLLIVAAMLAVAWSAARRSDGWPRWLAAVSSVAAVASVVLLLRSLGADAGLWQRLWLGTNLGWLLLATWTVGRQVTGASGWTATSPAR